MTTQRRGRADGEVSSRAYRRKHTVLSTIALAATLALSAVGACSVDEESLKLTPSGWPLPLMRA